MYATSRFSEAVPLLMEAIKAAPNMTDGYHTLGMVYEAMGKVRSALDLFMIAAHLAPKDVSLWRRLAVLSTELGFYRRARASERASAHPPPRPAARPPGLRARVFIIARSTRRTISNRRRGQLTRRRPRPHARVSRNAAPQAGHLLPHQAPVARPQRPGGALGPRRAVRRDFRGADRAARGHGGVQAAAGRPRVRQAAVPPLPPPTPARQGHRGARLPPRPRARAGHAHRTRRAGLGGRGRRRSWPGGVPTLAPVAAAPCLPPRPQALEAYLSQHPDQSDATHVNILAELYMEMGHYEQAAALIERAERVMYRASSLPMDLVVKAGRCYCYTASCAADFDKARRGRRCNRAAFTRFAQPRRRRLTADDRPRLMPPPTPPLPKQAEEFFRPLLHESLDEFVDLHMDAGVALAQFAQHERALPYLERVLVRCPTAGRLCHLATMLSVQTAAQPFSSPSLPPPPNAVVGEPRVRQPHHAVAAGGQLPEPGARRRG